MDTARVNTFAAMVDIPFMSKRFAMKRFLGLSQEEITENETLWKEENLEDAKTSESASAEMRSVGVTSAGASSDLADIDSAGAPPEGMEGDMGGEAPAPGTPTTTPPAQ
jgi:hypothetical protein